MRDHRMTGYAPHAVAGVTPSQIVTVRERNHPCDGALGSGGHPRIWLRIVERQVTCPYCSITYVLEEGAGVGDDH